MVGVLRNFNSTMEPKRRSSSTLNRLSFCCRGTTINHLPDALLIEIFLRLPLKLVKQCTVVSKYWYALISSPYFGNLLHQPYYISTTLLLSCELQIRATKKLFLNTKDTIFRSHPFSLTYLPCQPKAEPPVVVASCGDLLLCVPSFFSHSVYYICNPVTAKWIQLPPTPAPHGPESICLGFTFEGQGSSFKYAVVRLQIFCDSYTLHIFTSDSANWSKKVGTGWLKLCGWNLQNTVGAPYEGSLFWITETYNALVSIDPFHKGGSLRVIALPHKPAPELGRFRFKEGYFQNAQLCICRGTLRLVEITTNDKEDVLCICVWDRKSFGKKEWYLEHINILSGLLSKNPTWYSGSGFMVHSIACDPIKGNTLCFRIEDNVIVSYDMHKKIFYDLCHFRGRVSCFGDAFIYRVPWRSTSIPSSPS